jgi:hypothetical protein
MNEFSILEKLPDLLLSEFDGLKYSATKEPSKLLGIKYCDESFHKTPAWQISNLLQ